MTTIAKPIFSSKTSKLIYALLFAVLISGCASNPGDSRAKQGAKSGAAWGAGLGLLIGILADDPAAGLAAGAAVGASHGAYEGWAQDQHDERTQEITAAIRESKSGSQQSSLDADGRAREELTRFLGTWSMKGWAQEPGGQRTDITAKVNGNIEMTYFVELAYIDLKASGVNKQIWGTSMFGYDKDDGYTVNTTINLLHEAMRADGGAWNQGSRSFVFSGADYQMVIRFETPDRFTLKTTANGATVESYQFTRA